jgi:lysophospholipase L1-like esterase
MKTSFRTSVVAALFIACGFARAAESPDVKLASYDVVVYGGTSGGVTAAVEAASEGRTVVLLEPGKHLGGLTSGGLGATDIGKADSIGGMSREFYKRVKSYYINPAVWNQQKAEEYVSHRHDPAADVMWHFEPHVAEQLYNELIADAGVEVIYGQRLDLKKGVRLRGKHIDHIVMESGRTFRGKVFIDATYEGDLMAKAGVSYHVGREDNSVYGETMNGVQRNRVPYSPHTFCRPVDGYVVPGDKSSGLLYGIQNEPAHPDGTGDRLVQAYNFRICMTEAPDNRVPFIKPEGYDPAHYELILRHLQTEGTDKLFADYPKPREIEHPALGYRPYIVIMPNLKTDMNSKGAASSDFVGGNYDYPEADHATRERIVAEHRRYHQGMLWFLANDPRVPSKYRDPLQTWGLAKDEFLDNDHWPHQLYVREARRMIGEYVMIEQDCSGKRRADDSIGLGSYGMDSHTCQRYVDEHGYVRNEGTIGGKVLQPYPISYRSLTPKRGECDNLLVPVCCSASHCAYGSIRMEPVFMILGQSAGAAAVMAIQDGVAVQDVSYPKLRERLTALGQRLTWPLSSELEEDSTGLTIAEKQRIEAATLATRRSPAMKDATAKFNVASKAYRDDRAKFPAERSHDVAVAYRKATKEYEAATRKAMLDQYPELAPLVAKADAAAKGPKRAINEGETIADSDSMKNPAIAPIHDVPGLPRVLLIGDSISIGYTLPVRELLKGKANVHRIPVNGGATEVGLERIDSWLGDGQWDVIHFNFGLHDAKHASETTFRSSRGQYADNLRTLVTRMQGTEAKLIFATTTPVPNGGVLTPTRKFDSITARNDIAVKVMRENGVAIDDLYAVALPVMEQVGRPNDVHFAPEGYAILAKAVAASIESQLPSK